MDFKQVILSTLSLKEIENILHEKKKGAKPQTEITREQEIEDYLKSKILKFKNPIIQK